MSKSIIPSLCNLSATDDTSRNTFDNGAGPCLPVSSNGWTARCRKLRRVCGAWRMLTDETDTGREELELTRVKLALRKENADLIRRKSWSFILTASISRCCAFVCCACNLALKSSSLCLVTAGSTFWLSLSKIYKLSVLLCFMNLSFNWVRCSRCLLASPLKKFVVLSICECTESRSILAGKVWQSHRRAVLPETHQHLFHAA